MAESRPGLRRRGPRRRRYWPGSRNIRAGRRGPDPSSRRKPGPQAAKVAAGLPEVPAFAGMTEGSGRPSHHRVGKPRPRLALGFGDLARRHLLGNLGPAFLAAIAAVEGGEV